MRAREREEKGNTNSAPRFYATLILFYQNLLKRFENATEVLEKVQVGIDLLSMNANLYKGIEENVAVTYFGMDQQILKSEKNCSLTFAFIYLSMYGDLNHFHFWKGRKKQNSKIKSKTLPV